MSHRLIQQKQVIIPHNAWAGGVTYLWEKGVDRWWKKQFSSSYGNIQSNSSTVSSCNSVYAPAKSLVYRWAICSLKFRGSTQCSLSGFSLSCHHYMNKKVRLLNWLDPPRLELPHLSSLSWQLLDLKMTAAIHGRTLKPWTGVTWQAPTSRSTLGRDNWTCHFDRFLFVKFLIEGAFFVWILGYILPILLANWECISIVLSCRRN